MFFIKYCISFYTIFLIEGFNLNYISTKLRKKTITNHNVFNDDSFHGVWNLSISRNNKIESNFITLSPNGKLVSPSNLNTKVYGVWYTKNLDVTLVMFNYNSFVTKIYYGQTINNSINVNGTIVYGADSPDYEGKFTMKPVFKMLHNVTLKNETEKTKVNEKYVLGNWLFENINTKNIFTLSIFDNYTWQSNHFTNNISVLGGIWNLHDSNTEIDITSGIHKNGDYIWLLAEKLGSKNKNRLNIVSDILYLGKITHLTNQYLNSNTCPSSNGDEIECIAYKINGTVIYGFENEPEISESFYMTRWWN
tara:strand:- start:2021 stop:2941 length:921 start_codon:yes stop_codon:yes gene_type:complete